MSENPLDVLNALRGDMREMSEGVRASLDSLMGRGQEDSPVLKGATHPPVPTDPAQKQQTPDGLVAVLDEIRAEKFAVGRPGESPSPAMPPVVVPAQPQVPLGNPSPAALVPSVVPVGPPSATLPNGVPGSPPGAVGFDDDRRSRVGSPSMPDVNIPTAPGVTGAESFPGGSSAVSRLTEQADDLLDAIRDLTTQLKEGQGGPETQLPSTVHGPTTHGEPVWDMMKSWHGEK